MKKAGKYILYFLGFCFACFIIYTIIGLFQGKSVDEIMDEANEPEQTQIEQTQEGPADKDTTSVNPKPDDFIEDINLEQALQLAINNKGMLEGRLSTDKLSPEEKVADADEIEARVKPYRDTLLYLIQEDSNDGGDYDYYRMDVYYAVDNVYSMSHYLKEYLTTGDQEDLDDFNKSSANAQKYIDLAQENQNN